MGWGPLARGQNGVMIREFGAVDISLAERLASFQTLYRFGGQGMFQAFEDAREQGQHILGDMATLGARVADEFVGLIEGLGLLQDLGGREAKAAVGVTLQIGEVIKGRWPVMAHLLVYPLYPALGMRRQFPLEALGLGPIVEAGLAIPAITGAEALRQGRH